MTRDTIFIHNNSKASSNFGIDIIVDSEIVLENEIELAGINGERSHGKSKESLSGVVPNISPGVGKLTAKAHGQTETILVPVTNRGIPEWKTIDITLDPEGKLSVEKYIGPCDI